MNNTQTMQQHGAQNAILSKTSEKPKVEERIERIEELLERLKKEREELETGTPPPRGREMKEHIMNLADRIDLSDDDIIYRRRESNGEKVRVPTGFNKDGVVKINNALYEVEQEIEELRSKYEGEDVS